MPVLRCIPELGRDPILAHRRAAETCEIAHRTPETCARRPLPYIDADRSTTVKPLRLRARARMRRCGCPSLARRRLRRGPGGPAREIGAGEAVHPSACEAERMSPVRDLRGVSFYTDAAKSVADPALKQAADEAVRPLWDFVKAVDALVDAGPPPAQDCALRALAAWARGGALLGRPTSRAATRGRWRSGLIAGVRAAGDARAARPRSTRAWPTGCAAWRSRSSRPTRAPGGPTTAKTTPTGPASRWPHGDTTGDPPSSPGGCARLKLGIARIRPDGTLPLEMARGARALHYDLFALTPLVMTAEIGLRHGVDLYTARHGALRRLAERRWPGSTTRPGSRPGPARRRTRPATCRPRTWPGWSPTTPVSTTGPGAVARPAAPDPLGPAGRERDERFAPPAS